MYLRFESNTGRISAQEMDNFNHFWTADRRGGLGRVFRVPALLCLGAHTLTSSAECLPHAATTPAVNMPCSPTVC